jgi:hypothetical protein
MRTTNPILLRIDPTPFAFVSLECTMPSHDGPRGRRAFISCCCDIQMFGAKTGGDRMQNAGITLVGKKQL